MRALFIIVGCLAISGGGSANAALLQVDKTIAVPGDSDTVRRLSTRLRGGRARVRVAVRNQPDGRTLRIDLGFRYRIPEDSFPFDEIIGRIEVSVADQAGNEVSLGRIGFGEGGINLNPNSAALLYRTTLIGLRPRRATRCASESSETTSELLRDAG